MTEKMVVKKLAGGFLLRAVVLAAGAAQAAEPHDVMGKVARYSITDDGVVSGLLLTDGTTVELPASAAQRLVAAVKPGDTVTVRGKRESGQVIEAVAVVNNATGELAGVGAFAPVDAEHTAAVGR